MSLLGRVQLASRAHPVPALYQLEALGSSVAYAGLSAMLVEFAAAVTVELNLSTHTGGLQMDRTFAFTLLVISAMMLAGCELVGDIFEAGVWVGVILVILIVGLVVWLFARGRT